MATRNDALMAEAILDLRLQAKRSHFGELEWRVGAPEPQKEPEGPRQVLVYTVSVRPRESKRGA